MSMHKHTSQLQHLHAGMDSSDDTFKPSYLMTPLPRDHRGSLEVFDPASFSARSTNPVFGARNPTRLTRPNPPNASPEFNPVRPALDSHNSVRLTRSNSANALPELGLPKLPTSSPELTSWMALKQTPSSTQPSDTTAAARAAEWGLVLKTDSETGKPKGVTVRTSGGSATGEDQPETSRGNSNNSSRSSGESDDGAGPSGGFPRVSEDLKDALSTFQQTFVVSDATKPDFPIMYASEGFFRMTGYTNKEVIGRNCRFLQGADTDPGDVSKLREALQNGTSYCGRLLNYKKDGTSFWNLLTIAPIKDDTGKVLKLIGMQVEVSKHTEGSKDKMLRPNGLPESLIRYDARQKDMATSSVAELLQAVKRPRSLSLSSKRDFRRKSEGDVIDGREKTTARRNSDNAVPPRRNPPTKNQMQRISESPERKQKKSVRRSFMRLVRKSESLSERFDAEVADDTAFYDDEDYEETDSDARPDSVDDKARKREMRKGIDLATTLERIEKNFVITDPRLPDNPIIFASDSFLELTEYSREEILGRNCRFLQGPETDPATVSKIREAIDKQTEVTVQLINYTKSGTKFWNIFHLQPMRDQKGEVQYFIGVQLDGSQHVEPLHNCVPEATAQESAKLVKETAGNVGEAVKELPDANLRPEDLWANHSKTVRPKPHRRDSPAWNAIQRIIESGEPVGLNHFRPVKPLGSGDTGSVHLVELTGTGHYFAMKAMDKSIMLNRNKVHRACAEREILDMLDHPFLPALYASFQTKTHICLITDYCPGGELFLLLENQPKKVLKEDDVRFYAAEVVVALEYLHCQGIIYRDLKPENVLLQGNGHVTLTDFDLSCLTSCKPQLLIPERNEKKKQQKRQQPPIFVAEPMRASNSFVGTEEYIAPEIISGAGHTSAVDWWALGILVHEMLYGYTPFRGKTRQKTFSNILYKDLKFPARKHISLQAKQLIYQLLQRDPKYRLGSIEGANEIKRHPFFKGVNWALVRCMNPPELDAPLFGKTEGQNEAKFVNPAMEDMLTNVF